MHVNREYVRQGFVGPRQYFRQADLTDQAAGIFFLDRVEHGQLARDSQATFCPRESG